MSEKCDRCGKEGEDRRTLKMACFYQLNELGLPLEEFAIHGLYKRKIGEKPIPGFSGLKTSVFAEPEPDAQPSDHQFYSMRVCKRCRSDWMEMLITWFHTDAEGVGYDSDDEETPGVGSGIFIRENGTLKEVSEKEWYEKNPGRDPIRVLSKVADNVEDIEDTSDSQS